jgi:hypothetical protein
MFEEKNGRAERMKCGGRRCGSLYGKGIIT